MIFKVFLASFIFIVSTAMASTENDFINIIYEGNRLHDQGQYDAAIAKYREAEKLDPKSALVNYEIGLTYYTMRDLKKSLQYLKKAEKLNKDVRLIDAICNALGSAYDDMKMPDSAITTYRKGAKNNPNSHLIPFNAAITFTNIGKLDSAKVWISKAVKNTKLHEGTYYQATIIAEKRKDWLDLYSYGMYALFISRKTENKNSLYNILYHHAKKPSASTHENGMNESFLSALYMTQIPDPTNHKDYTQKDTTSAMQIEFLIHTFTESIKMISDMKDYMNPLKSLYQGLIQNNFVETFVYMICKEIDRPTYAKWAIKNKSSEDKMFKWLNEDYSKNR